MSESKSSEIFYINSDDNNIVHLACTSETLINYYGYITPVNQLYATYEGTKFKIIEIENSDTAMIDNKLYKNNDIIEYVNNVFKIREVAYNKKLKEISWCYNEWRNNGELYCEYKQVKQDILNINVFQYTSYMYGRKFFEKQYIKKYNKTTEKFDDVNHGCVSKYDFTGQKHSFYENGVKHGKEITYSDDGIIESEKEYKDGVLNGKYITYENICGENYIKDMKHYKNGIEIKCETIY